MKKGCIILIAFCFGVLLLIGLILKSATRRVEEIKDSPHAPSKVLPTEDSSSRIQHRDEADTLPLDIKERESASADPTSEANNNTQSKTTIFEEREWMSADGKRTFIGKLTNLGNGELTVEKDGKPITFAINLLSPNDREFLGQGVTILTKSGKTFTGGSVASLSLESVTYMAPDGVSRIPMADLPDEMAFRFGYDPALIAKMNEAKEHAKSAALANEKVESELEAFMAVLRLAGADGSLISRASVKGETIKLTVASGWHYQPKAMRQQNAQILWQAWAMIHSPDNLDLARLELVDAVGNRVGGSRFLAGSLIWVIDE